MENLKGKWLVIRADASTEMGSGHLMRTLALAQAWKDSGGKVAFITGCHNKKLLKRLYDEGFTVYKIDKPHPDSADWKVTGNTLASYPDTWVVLDGYYFDGIYQKLVRNSGHRLLVIDDMAYLEHYYPDILLNQNHGSEQLPYSCEPYTRLLLGTQYALLRREYLKWKTHKRIIPETAKHVLVTLGGSDPANVTLKVMKALQEIDIPGSETIIVIGAGNPNAESLKEVARKSHAPVDFIIDAKNMPELMAWADVAISGGGSTGWELAFMGLPVVLMVISDNQREIARNLSIAGAGLNLGWHLNVKPSDIKDALIPILIQKIIRTEMSERGRQLVDGEGASRVVLSIVQGKGK